MANMKLSDDEVKEYATNSTLMADKPEYPYGLCINLGTEAISKLNLKEMPKPGQLLKFSGVVEVKSVSVTEQMDEEADKSMNLQIVDLELGDAVKEEKKEISAGSLYGNNSAGIKLPPGATILGSGYF